MFKTLRNLALAALLVTFGMAQTAPAADLPALDKPIAITSLGQSPDAKTLSVLAKRAKMPSDFKPLASAADIKDHKTIFVSVGVSLKGFGSAGVNVDTEKKRCDEIVEQAKNSGAYMILVHIGGSGRRDGMTNTLLEYFAPHADAFIVFAEGNKDEFFTKAAGDKPLILLPKTMDIVKTLTAVNTGS